MSIVLRTNKIKCTMHSDGVFATTLSLYVYCKSYTNYYTVWTLNMQNKREGKGNDKDTVHNWFVSRMAIFLFDCLFLVNNNFDRPTVPTATIKLFLFISHPFPMKFMMKITMSMLQLNTFDFLQRIKWINFFSWV